MSPLKFIAAAVVLISSTAASASITDPLGDFLPTYTGPHDPNVDIVGADVAFDGSTFYFTTTTNGSVGTTPNSVYAWTLNRGSGIARPALASPAGGSLLWDAVVAMFPDGSLRVVTFSSSGGRTITNISGGTRVSGNSLSGSVPALMLPSTGFLADEYTFDLWSRVRLNPAVDGANSEVADLLAGSGDIHAAAVPEPAAWSMMLLGFAGIALAARNRKIIRAKRV